MAQWLGFGSGHTHQTRVEDAEDLLRHAVGAFRAAVADDERRRQGKAVRRLAGQVLWARLRWLKARTAAAREARLGGAPAGRAPDFDSLQRRYDEVNAGGLAAILAEFGAGDASGQ